MFIKSAGGPPAPGRDLGAGQKVCPRAFSANNLKRFISGLILQAASGRYSFKISVKRAFEGLFLWQR